MRITKEEMFLSIARTVAKRSTCPRLQVGCIITDRQMTTILSMGYNGNARGMPNHCDRDEPGNCGCVHAEMNALVKAPYQSRLIMFCTHNPCAMCAKLILNSGVQAVVFDQLYRNTIGIDLLKQNHITVVQGANEIYN